MPQAPFDNGRGDPAAMRGRAMPIAEWAIRHATTAMNGVRQVLRPAQPPPRSAAPAPQPPAVQPGMQVGPVMRVEPRLAADWFGPGNPPMPMAPADAVAGRAFDYRPGENMAGKPRQYSGVSFDQLRGLADHLNIARLCLETRKDQMGALSWSILPKQQPGETLRAKADDRCRTIETFLRRPDRKKPWDTWLRLLLEEMFVVDAPAIFIRRTRGGDVFALEILDGSMIKPLIDESGRTPDPPTAAYQQVLKGMPVINYTTDELIYAPRNQRSNHLYGLSVIEQIVMTVNIALRREIVKLNYFTDGNIPDALVSVPKEWGPDSIAKFQVTWDQLLKDAAGQGGLRFVPGDMNFAQTRSDAMLMGPFDEWIARVVCFAFSLAPTAFVQQQNRATADTAKETALEEGLRPTMVWTKGTIDQIIETGWGYDDIELVFDDVKDMDVAVERDQDRADVAAGILSVDEVRAKRGLDPLGMGNAIQGGPNGIVFLADLIEAQRNGLTKIQPPMAPPQLDAMGNPVPALAGGPVPALAGGPPQPPQLNGPGSAGQLAIAAPGGAGAENPPGTPANGFGVSAAPAGNAGASGPTPISMSPASGALAQPERGRDDPLAGIPADILANVGLGPQGSGGRITDVTRKEETARDPEMAAVGHPQVLATLRAAEALHKRAPVRRLRRPE